MHIHVFNPEHDIALVSGERKQTVPKVAIALRRDIGFLPVLWARRGDVVLVDDADIAMQAARQMGVADTGVLFLEDKELSDYLGDDDNLRTRCCRVDAAGNPVGKDGKEITSPYDIKTIPEVLRYIDDNDIWKHKIPATMAFSWGFRLCENKHPLSAIWSLLFDETINAAHIGSIIDDGEVILRYRKITDFKNLYNGFYVNIDGHNVVFLNTIEGNSSIFQEVYDYADAVCKYSFTGNYYTYTFYSKDDGANCLDIVTYLRDTYRDEYEFVSGGGHLHASGVTFKKDIVSAFEIDKKSYAELRKKIRIDKEVAIEQKRYEEEQKKLSVNMK